MAYSVEQLDSEPIIIVSLGEQTQSVDETTQTYQEVAALLDALSDKAFLITDYTKSDLTFSEMALSLRTATQGEAGSPTDPRILQNLLIGTDELVEMASQSLMQTQYGKVKTLVFANREDALTYARALLSS